MRAADPVDEYLHAPGRRRLWNESYYVQFSGADLVGHTRLGFQPAEDRANVWFYLHDLADDRTVFHRDEDLPAGAVHGLHVDAEPLEVGYRIVEPTRRWRVRAAGRCRVAGRVRDVFAGGDAGADWTGDRVPVEADLTFREPDHDAYQEDRGYDAHSPDKEHYSQPGRVAGTVRIGDDERELEATGFRDHSWGGLRDWTPTAGGYCWFALRVGDRHAFKVAAGRRPDGTTTDDVYGYHADGTSVRVARDLDVDYGADRTPDGRLRAWLDGDLPSEISVGFDLADGRERLTLVPAWNTPLGFEDRNWAATDLETPWLTAVINRLPVAVRWGDREGRGWFETMHPRVRAGD